MAARTADGYGRIDVLVNNAGWWGNLKPQRFEEVEEQLWDATMAVNVKGVWLAFRAAAQYLKSGDSGSIINIASLAATYGMANVIHYTTSKAAVIGLTGGLRGNWGATAFASTPSLPTSSLRKPPRNFSVTSWRRPWPLQRPGNP